MQEYAPYIALLIIAIGLGGPAVWAVLKTPPKPARKPLNDADHRRGE